jgi:hypothetical protein
VRAVILSAAERSGAKNLALDFSADKQQGEMLRCAQHDRPESRMKPDSQRVRSANRFLNSLRRLEKVAFPRLRGELYDLTFH